MIALSGILEFSSQLMFTATVLGTLASGKKTQPLAARSCDWLLTF